MSANDQLAADLSRIEAPVTAKAYLMCVFSAFGGIFFGYDSGYINGVIGMAAFIKHIEGANATTLSATYKALIISFLSLGTLVGSLVAGEVAERIGRRPTVIGSCVFFMFGVLAQLVGTGLLGFTIGRAIAGMGIGGVSAVLILYMSEIAPRKVRGAIVAGYQFCITLGLLLASAIDYATEKRTDSSAFQIPIAIQIIWALILGIGLFFLPESPRYYVRNGELGLAAHALSRLRGQPATSQYIRDELTEIMANYERERGLHGSYRTTWLACFGGRLGDRWSNLRRTILGVTLQMMSQWTGVNFTNSFQDLGTIQNPFFISLITTLAIEKMGRRRLFLFGAAGMVICQFVVAIVGTVSQGPTSLTVMIAFICLFIFFFATTWGPGSWVLIGEIFPLETRARGVALSTASNWFWNFIIGLITPYMVDKDKGNLGAKVFFIWGSLCTVALIFTWFLVPETKGLTLEQIDKMLRESSIRDSAKWTPHSTYAIELGVVQQAPDSEPPALPQTNGHPIGPATPHVHLD
ncbi:general substrate transporter [Xylaria sp. CBS 124048]|nr:general substrate transporter [Xylaria sp. CBS 124048]